MQAPNHKQKLGANTKTQISRLRSSTAIACGDGSKASAGEARTKEISRLKS
jgi:hypothetical protein